jgi:two-component system sensor histidine kinase KdpD
VLFYRHYLIALILLALITLLSQLFRTQLELINIALIHLVPVIVIALRGNMMATMFITTISVLMFDLLYVPPRYSFDVHDLIYVWSFIIFFVVGYTITLQAKRIHENEIKTILLNTLSHDLKTPLSSILGSASLLIEEEKLSAQSRQGLLEQIRESGQQMDRLIGTLLDSARLKHSSVLKKEWCDLEDLVGVALQEFRNNPLRDRLEVSIEGDLQLFWGDRALLIRMLVNLMDNAFKYSRDHKQTRISISSSAQNVTILLFNESPPIKSEDLNNIFDRFYRLQQSADIGGSGIGLSICKDIATAHSGNIRAYNVNGGVCFEVNMPILRHPSSRPKETA